MPCTCDGYPDPIYREKNKPYFDPHNNPAADALCKIMREHESRGEMGCFDAKALAWWEDHKMRDKYRVEKDMIEAKRRLELFKSVTGLTDEELRRMLQD